MAMAYMPPGFDRELKKGSTELAVLSLLERRPRHGYEICKLIEERSEGAMRLNVAAPIPSSTASSRGT